MYSISFNGKNCLQYGILPVRRPDIPAAEKEVEEITIPGRDGILTESKERYLPVVISIEFNFMKEPDEWAGAFRKAKKWLQGSGNLEFSDDAHYLYKVYYCKITDSERTSRKIGKFTAEFTCYPYLFVRDGQREKTIEEIKRNPYCISHPLYKITGEGLCRININGKEVSVNVGQNVTIDTERMIAYRTDGTIQNTVVTGEYEDLYLQEGDNEILVTDGFEISVIPNWRVL